MHEQLAIAYNNNFLKQSMANRSLAWPDPFLAGAYRLNIISATLQGAYNLQSISDCAERVWPRETRRIVGLPIDQSIIRTHIRVVTCHMIQRSNL